MKIKTLLLALAGLIYGYSEVYAQTGSELLTNTNFGTTQDGVTGVNNAATLYPTVQSQLDSVYYQPPTWVFNNVWWSDPSATPSNIAINPTVTIAPPLIAFPNTGWQTAYTFGCNETWFSNYYTFLNKAMPPQPYSNVLYSGVQIPMAPNNGYYVIGTSNQGMYMSPTLTGSSVWNLLYDRYEVNTANPTNYFLIVNGDQNGGKVFYQQQNVPVTAGHIYRMSSDIARINTGNDTGSAPNVAFWIGDNITYNANGAITSPTGTGSQNVYNTGYITDGGVWITYSFDYVAPCGANEITVAFANNQTNTNGNDLALDNLSFKEVIPQITMITDGDCNSLPFTFTLTAEIDVETPSNYTITWYRGGTSLGGGNLATNNTNLVTINNSSDASTYAGNYYYEITTTATSGCVLTSPVVTIPDISSTCDISVLNPEDDRINASPGVLTTDNPDNTANITDNDCDDGSCSLTDGLQIVNYTISTGIGIDQMAGTYQPGTPLLIIDDENRTVGVLTLDRAGNITFMEAPDYPAPSPAGNSTIVSAVYGIPEVVFTYQVVDTKTGAVGTATVYIAFTQLNYTVTASCVGYPVRVVFEIESFLDDDFQDPSNNTIPVGGGNIAAYNGKVNDAVATRFYLVNGNTGTEISDQAILAGNTNIRRIDVVRTGDITEGGFIIFEFIASTPGIMSAQLHKKAIYAPTSSGDPIMQKLYVQICPATATWAGQSSDLWQDPNNWISEGVGISSPIWCTDVTIPSPVSTSILNGNTTEQTISNFPVLAYGNSCRDIIFKMGASVGKVQYLSYRAAYVEYTPPEISPDSAQTLQNINNSSGKWTMISVPLKYVYSADFNPDTNWGANAFTDIKSYMSYFDLAYSTNGISNPDGVSGTSLGSFSRPFAGLKEPLPAGFGFASKPIVITDEAGTPTGNVFVETDSCKTQPYTFYFPRYVNFGNAKLWELPDAPFGPSNMATGLYNEAQYAYHYTDNGEWVTTQTAPNSNYVPFTFEGLRGVQNIKTYDTIPMPQFGNAFAAMTWGDNYYLDHDTIAYVLNNDSWDVYLQSSGGTFPPAGYNYLQAAVTYFPDTIANPVTGRANSINPISGRDSRFRFIFEEMNPDDFETKFGIEKQTTLDYNYDPIAGTFTLPILSYSLNNDGTLAPRPSAIGLTRIVGNPLMSHLDFDSLYYFNNTSIMPYYRLWDGTSYYTYFVTGTSSTPAWQGMPDLSTSSAGDNTSPETYRYIPPMQAFFIDVSIANENASLSLNFNTNMSTAIPNANITPYVNELRARPHSTNNNLLRLRLKMNEIETVALLASLPNASDNYNQGEDIYKLFSYDKATPEIYTIADKTAIEINAMSQEGEQKLIPIGIKTNRIGQFELRIEGADDFDAYDYVLLLDALSGEKYDLKEKTSFTFEKTAAENLEGRFYIVFSQETTEIPKIIIDTDNNQTISITREDETIRVYSSKADIESFEAFDISGRLLFKNIKINADTYLWSPKLEPGIYLLRVQAGEQNKVQKIKW